MVYSTVKTVTVNNLLWSSISFAYPGKNTNINIFFKWDGFKSLLQFLTCNLNFIANEMGKSIYEKIEPSLICVKCFQVISPKKPVKSKLTWFILSSFDFQLYSKLRFFTNKYKEQCPLALVINPLKKEEEEKKKHFRGLIQTVIHYSKWFWESSNKSS